MPFGRIWCFQLLSINNVISKHGLPDRGTRLKVSHSFLGEHLFRSGLTCLMLEEELIPDGTFQLFHPLHPGCVTDGDGIRGKGRGKSQPWTDFCQKGLAVSFSSWGLQMTSQ
jgi:hypothetical protein